MGAAVAPKMPRRMLRGTALAAVLACLCSLARPAAAASCYRFVTPADYPSCIQLDDNVVLHWRVDDDTLTLAPDADGYLSWLAIGISDAGLRGVDYNVVIRGVQGLNWAMGDYFTINGTLPVLDEHADAVLVVSPDFDRDNHTLAAWTRPLDPCDDEDVAVLQGVERTLVWGYSYRSNWDVDKYSFGSFLKGMRPGVVLLPAPNATAPLPPANATLNATLAMPALPVPPANSSVSCVNLALPNATAYHAVAYAGYNTTRYVHHMLGFVCAAGVAAPSAAVPLGVPYNCGPGQSALPPGCERLNFVWAPGAAAFVAPPAAGFAVGTAGAGGVFVLQVHYQNPAGDVGKLDSSGFNLTLTPLLRNASLGVLTLGNTDLRIPPATPAYTALPNICPAACTGARVRAPVTLVSNFYIMGRLGSATLTRHIRNGSAVQPLGRINYWDPTRTSFQSVFPLSRTLLPNDTLISLCTYDSSSVPRAMTFYGLNAWQELCFNYVTFYPLAAMPDLDYCVADTRKNITTCATRTALARAAAANATDTMQLANGTKMAVGTLNITTYRSQACLLHDQLSATPYHKPNTRAAVASVVLVPIVLLIIGWILWSKYTREEEMELLLAAARAEGVDQVLREAVDAD